MWLGKGSGAPHICIIWSEFCPLSLIPKNMHHGIAVSQGFPGSANGKEPTCQCRRHRRLGFDPWVQKISWRGTWQLSPVFLPGKSHGQRSLAGYSPWSQSQTWLNQLIMHTHVSCRDLPPQTSFLLFPDIQRFWQTLWRKPKKIYRRRI